MKPLRKLSAHSVICLAEFEALLHQEAFDDRFFNTLRSWQNEGLLSWVTASAQPLEALGKLHGHTSPFFNLLATVPLAGLTPTKAGQLLTLLVFISDGGQSSALASETAPISVTVRLYPRMATAQLSD